MKEVKKDIISISLVCKLAEIDEKHNISKYYNEAKGDTYQDKMMNLQFNMSNLPSKERKNVIDYYVNYYSTLKNIDKKKVEEMDFLEVKNEVNTFRIKIA
jgi:hypothetical protein